jgi:hypothetical protein
MLAAKVNVLRWMREHDYPWDVRVCHQAAAGGHLEVLQWAREHGCPWDDMTCITLPRAGT